MITYFIYSDDDNASCPKAVAGTLSGIFSNGQSTLICGQQWGRVQEELNKLNNLDDKWEFHSIYENGHQYGIGTSNNPNDPKLIMDPWRNKFTQKFK